MGKNMIILVALFLGACANNTSNIAELSPDIVNEKIEVRFHLTETEAYCGGAKPPQELLDELNTPKAMANTSIFLRNDTVNNIEDSIDYTFTSNQEGWINAKLPAGQYSVVFADKKDRKTYEDMLEQYKTSTRLYKAIDTDCLQSYFRQPEKVIHVTEKGENKYEIKNRKHCKRSVPCATYIGPVPPSAPPKNTER